MKKFQSNVLAAFILFVIGLAPMVLDVLSEGIFGKSAETYILPICYIMGGFLCVTFSSKVLKADIKKHIRKTDKFTAFLLIMTAFGYSLANAYIANRAIIEKAVDTKLTFEDHYTTVTSILFAPVSEELIFRLGMLLVLLIGAGKSVPKTVFSFAFSILLWMSLHFPKNAMRAVDIIIVGIMLSFIFVLSKNVISGIIFHIAANTMTFTSLYCAKLLVGKEVVKYAAAVVFLVFGTALFIRLYKKRSESEFQPPETLHELK